MARTLWRLERYRLRRDIGWHSLAREMREAGFPVSATTLYNIVEHPDRPDRIRGPHARTVHKISRFLDTQAERRKAERRKHRGRPPKLPRIGPCRDPLNLWFLEWREGTGLWRKYYANRAEARRALYERRAALHTARITQRLAARLKPDPTSVPVGPVEVQELPPTPGVVDE